MNLISQYQSDNEDDKVESSEPIKETHPKKPSKTSETTTESKLNPDLTIYNNVQNQLSLINLSLLNKNVINFLVK